MNILFLINRYPDHGGTEVVTTVLANAFQKFGHKVAIAAFEETRPELHTRLDQEIKFFKLQQPVTSPANVALLRQIIRIEKIDVIINQWCLPYFVTRLCVKATRGLRCKLIAVFHNQPDKNSRIVDAELAVANAGNSAKYLWSIIRRSAVRRYTAWNIRKVYHASDAYVILSKSFAPIFQKLTQLKDTSKLVVISNPLTNSPHQDIPAHEKENLICYVGRIDYNQKRVERIIRVWSRCVSKLTDWSMCIVGDGPDRKRLQTMVEECGIERVSFKGFQDPIPYMTRSKILLLTSEYEGFGLVIVEAMACGCVPVILGSYPAVYDIINDGKNGIIVPPPFDEVTFTNEVIRLAKDNSRLLSLYSETKLAAKQFQLERILQDWNNLFARLAEDTK